MKTTLIRTFVVALALSGMAATASVSNSAKHVATPTVAGVPQPVCPPGDPNGCGIL